MMRLLQLIQEQKLRSVVDSTRQFEGLDAVPDAIEHLYSGRNVGKVVVTLPPRSPARL